METNVMTGSRFLGMGVTTHAGLREGGSAMGGLRALQIYAHLSAETGECLEMKSATMET
jgi:hypothetical protein